MGRKEANGAGKREDLKLEKLETSPFAEWA
jgi:hypothetical protein